MQISATFSQSELERLICQALKEEHHDVFPHGAHVKFNVTTGQRDEHIVSATATPATYVQPKD